MKGKFFAFEGIDGSGKSTQIALLADRLRKADYKVFVTEEPSRGEIGQFTRHTLQKDHSITEASSALLFAADRLDHLYKPGGILDLLQEDVIILCDRYLLSSLTYNSLANPLEWVVAINQPAIEAFRPTAHLLFDLPAQAAIDRIHNRDLARERYEDLHQLHRVRMLYRQLADTLTTETFVLLNADQDPNLLALDVWQAVSPYLAPLAKGE